MELRQIKYFVTVAEYLNISKAARKLNTSQPSLGRQIQSLENYIGVPLFDRVKKRLVLTQAGEIFYHQAKSIMNNINSAISITRVNPEQRKRGVVVGFIPPISANVFPSFFPFLGSCYPDIYPMLKNLSSEAQVAALKNNLIDVAFMLYRTNHDSLSVQPIADGGSLCVLLPTTHPLAARFSLALSDLRGMPFVQTPKFLQQQIEDHLGPLNFRPLETSGGGERDNLFAQLSLVASGLGFTLVTDAVRDFIPPTVTMCPLKCEKPVTFTLYAAWRKDDPSDAVRDFLDALWLWKKGQQSPCDDAMLS